MAFFLTAKGLRSVNIDEKEKNFSFVFENLEYHCSLFHAEFLSPKVSLARKNDPTMGSFNVDFSFSKDSVVKIDALIAGLGVELKDKEDECVKFLLEIGNIDVLSSNPFANINSSNVLDLLALKLGHGAEVQNEIDYVAEHFESLKNENISLESLLMILGSHKLKLDTEDSLLAFISKKIGEDPSASILLRFIKCEFLNKKEIEIYVELVNKLDNENIGSLWPSIQNRLLDRPPTIDYTRYNGVNIPFDGKNRFNGIIHDLSTKCGGNVIDKGIINVSASSTNSSSYPLRNIIQKDGDWASNNTQGSWVTFDIIDKNIKLTSYTLRSCSSVWSNYYPQSWRLEGSNDGSSWKKIDEKINCNDQNGNLQEGTYDVVSENYFRYLRLTQTDYNIAGNHYFVLNQVEFFGSTISSK